MTDTYCSVMGTPPGSGMEMGATAHVSAANMAQMTRLFVLIFMEFVSSPFFITAGRNVLTVLSCMMVCYHLLSDMSTCFKTLVNIYLFRAGGLLPLQ